MKKNSTPKPSLVKELVKMFMKHVKCMSQIIMLRLLGSIGKGKLENRDEYSVELKAKFAGQRRLRSSSYHLIVSDKIS